MAEKDSRIPPCDAVVVLNYGVHSMGSESRPARGVIELLVVVIVGGVVAYSIVPETRPLSNGPRVILFLTTVAVWGVAKLVVRLADTVRKD